MGMTIAFTGHRPNKLGGYAPNNPIRDWVSDRIRQELIRLKPTMVISGMALGVDQWAAQVACDLGIPFIAAVPFKGQEGMWPGVSKHDYRRLMKEAHEVVVVCEGGYSAHKMQLRNEYMVDRCDVLIAVWDGTPGGTGNCVRYATNKRKNIVQIDPTKMEDDSWA